MAKTTDKTIVYVTRDLERALGTQTVCASYFIITNSTPFAKEYAKEQPHCVLITESGLLDTHELLSHQQTQHFISTLTNPSILVFKNTPTIERICADAQWPLLNPAAQLASTIEEKISQIEWLGELSQLLPPHQILPLKEVRFDVTPFILQFNRAHTGNGTILIDNDNTLRELQEKFPERPVRLTDFVPGTMLTSNNVVCTDTIIVGNPNVQITGLAPFTDKPFATVGNDWALGNSLLNNLQKNKYKEIVISVGEKLRASGWRGLFGTDIMLAANGQLYLIEINARQPAGTTFESQLQQFSTTFDAHLLSLLGEEAKNQTITPINDGAQLILRNQATSFSESCLTVFCERLKTAGFGVTRYQNTEPGSDLVRIQSTHGLMKTPTELNESGESIVKALNCSA